MLIRKELWYKELPLDVEFECGITLENSGIGSYEYWGFKGYDAGVDYAICEEIEWDVTNFTEDQNEYIQQWLDKNWEDLEKEAVERYWYEYNNRF